MKSSKFILAVLLSASVHGIAAETTVDSVLAKAEEFDKNIKKATFKFEETFTLMVTSETEKIVGRVYIDRVNNQVRVDYSGAVKAKVWIGKDLVYFYDQSLNQVVVRKTEDFQKVHLQAFMDIPLIYGTSHIRDRFDVKLGSGSINGNIAELEALPKSQSPYKLKLRFNTETGEPQGLDLLLENYQARLTVSSFDKNAKFKKTLFDKNFGPETAVLDLTREK